MSGDRGFSFPITAISVAALLVSGTYLAQQMLDSLRLTEADAVKVRLADPPVEARLWEDPFAAVDRHRAKLKEGCDADKDLPFHRSALQVRHVGCRGFAQGALGRLRRRDGDRRAVAGRPLRRHRGAAAARALRAARRPGRPGIRPRRQRTHAPAERGRLRILCSRASRLPPLGAQVSDAFGAVFLVPSQPSPRRETSIRQRRIGSGWRSGSAAARGGAGHAGTSRGGDARRPAPAAEAGNRKTPRSHRMDRRRHPGRRMPRLPRSATRSTLATRR